jgi:CheY-like chemotaxis protein
MRRAIRPAQDRPKILLAFSGPVQRAYLTAALASQGYEIYPCDSGSIALMRLSSGYYDAVVTGIVMPHVDGLELLREIRRRRDGVPVIAVTEGADPIDQVYHRCAMLAGAIAAHTIDETWGALLQSLDWIVRARTMRFAK